MPARTQRSSRNALVRVRARTDSSTAVKESSVRLLHYSLQQPGRHANVPHSITCTKDKDALLKAGMMEALMQHRLAEHSTTWENYRSTAPYALGILTWLSERYPAVCEGMAA